jgi:hypothetical protein
LPYSVGEFGAKIHNQATQLWLLDQALDFHQGNLSALPLAVNFVILDDLFGLDGIELDHVRRRGARGSAWHR